MSEILSLKEFMETKFETGKPIVSGLLSKQELLLAIAPSKTCKSFFAINTALAVASSAELFDKLKTVPCRVLYWQTEISESMLQERIFKLLEEFKLSPEQMNNLFITSERLKIDTVDGLARLRYVIHDLLKIDYLILDPFYTLHTKEENSASDMSSVLTNLKDLLRETNVGCLMIHHEGKFFEGKSKNINHRGRGSSAIGDVPDGHLYLKRDSDRQFTVDGNFRNYQPFSLKLEMSENMKFSVSTATKSPKISLNTDILKILSVEPKFKKDLIECLRKIRTSSNSAIDKTLQELAAKGEIISKKVGKVALYSLPEHHQHNNLLIEENDDDVIVLDRESYRDVL